MGRGWGGGTDHTGQKGDTWESGGGDGRTAIVGGWRCEDGIGVGEREE